MLPHSSHSLNHFQHSLTTAGTYLNLYDSAALESVAIPVLTFLGKDLVVFRCHALTFLSAPSLLTLNGEVSVSENAALAILDVPSVNYLSGVFVVDNPALLAVELPRSYLIMGPVTIQHNKALELMSIPSVMSVRGALTVTNNTALRNITAHLLNTTMDVLLTGNLQLPDLHWPSLTAADALTITSNALLTAVLLPSFVIAMHTLKMDDNAALASIEAPHMSNAYGDLIITRNPSLTSLVLQNLWNINGLFVNNNQQLNVLRLPQLDALSGTVVICHNGGWMFCWCETDGLQATASQCRAMWPRWPKGSSATCRTAPPRVTEAAPSARSEHMCCVLVVRWRA